MKTKFWPPQFFTGQRGCGCCQPPPPPPPQTGYYGYYGGKVVRQLNECTRLYEGQFYNFCHSADGSVTAEDPARYWLLEIDSFQSVTAESPDDPYGGCVGIPATATTCENANGTFVLSFFGNFALSEDWGERIIDGSPTMLRHVYQQCVWISPAFEGIRKQVILGTGPQNPTGEGCYVCYETGMEYRLEVTTGLLINPVGGAIHGSVRTAKLDLNAWSSVSGWIAMASWAPPLFRDNDTYIGDLNIWTDFKCVDNNVMPLVFAEDGFGPLSPSYLAGWPRCCTGAPNAIELVPL